MSARSGRCLCGAVAFTCTPKPHDDGVHVDACHCSMCRRLVGGPLLGVTLDGPPTIDNRESLTTYASSEWAERQFCKVCGSNLFYQLKDGGLYTVIAGALDDDADAKLTVEIFVDEKPSYYDFSQVTTKMTGAEVMAAFASGESAS
ncbi:MAG: GFA family protein [Pseudomonadota bacterium]